METVAIEMNVWDARKAFQEYRKHVGAESTEEDKALLECYRNIARGAKVIDLQRTMVAADFCPPFGEPYPRLAVCRADAARVTLSYEWQYNGVSSGWCPRFRPSYTRARRKSDTFLLPGTFGVNNSESASKFRSAVAQVPVIPPAIRPKKNLHRYLILWEAEWQREPQKDPLLLRPIGAGMYAIVAQWNMTPLEAAIAAGRL